MTLKLANTKKGKENPPSAYKAEPITGPAKYPNAWKNSAMATFQSTDSGNNYGIDAYKGVIKV